MSTVSLFADDVSQASDWYADLLGIQPYFVRPLDGPPAYIEFRIGPEQHELGIIDARYAPHRLGDGGIVLYWHVDDPRAAYEELLTKGATEHEGPIERGEGFVTASVRDPFGNIVGVIRNPHARPDVEGSQGGH
ncbi:VOC family protein [Prauserella salsuginis]|uniref:VOC family protein n=2 Tax=Prauserella salsuginis group TaxID=2893672 RepID=A0ABW6G4J8_9PSEU|nr:VOC family protein [Prauserella salsuginis]